MSDTQRNAKDYLGTILVAEQEAFHGRWIHMDAISEYAKNNMGGAKVEAKTLMRILNKLNGDLVVPAKEGVNGGPGVPSATFQVLSHSFSVQRNNKQSKHNTNFYFFKQANTSVDPEHETCDQVSARVWQERYNDCMLAAARKSKRRHGGPDAETSDALLELRMAKRRKAQEAAKAKEMNIPETREEALELVEKLWDKASASGKVPCDFSTIRSLIDPPTVPTPRAAISPSPPTIETTDASFTPVQESSGRIKFHSHTIESSGHVVENVPNTHTVIATSLLTQIYTDKLIGATLRKKLEGNKADCSKETSSIIAAFAAAHPTVSADTFANIIAIGRQTMVLELQALSSYVRTDERHKARTKRWRTIGNATLNVEGAINSSPKASAIFNYIEELAVDQVMLLRPLLMQEGVAVNFQEDGTPNGESAQAINVWDAKNQRVYRFHLGLSKCGKKGPEIVKGLVHKLELLGLEDILKVTDLTSDSGAGTPESLFRDLLNASVTDSRILIGGNSCGHHDTQSVFRLPLQELIGDGGLGQDNAVQLLHAIFDLYHAMETDAKGLWPKLAEKVFKDLDELLNTPIPKELLKRVQEALITRWWTIGCLAKYTMKNWKTLKYMTMCVINQSKSDSKIKKIASGLFALMREPALKAQVAFITAVAEHAIDPMMKWYGSMDPKIGTPGHLRLFRLLLCERTSWRGGDGGGRWQRRLPSTTYQANKKEPSSGTKESQVSS